MTNINKNKIFGCLFLIVLLFFVFSCTKEPPNVNKTKPIVDTTSQTNGAIFVCNEGPFLTGTGTISRIDRKSKTIINGLFETVNNRPLGNIVQSMTIHNGKAYIVVNNANKIEIVDVYSFKSLGTIQNLQFPRFMYFFNQEKALITQWCGKIAVYNSINNQIEQNINTEKYPERMVFLHDKAFVINSAGFSNDSTMSVINTISLENIQTIVVGSNPAGIVMDKNNMIWVLCKGSYNKEKQKSTNGCLVQINPDNLQIVKKFNLQGTYFDAKLTINANRDVLYYSYVNGVYQQSINDTNLSNILTINNRQFYHIEVDMYDNTLIALDAKDFVQRGYLIRYNLNSVPATKIDSFQVGIIPSSCSFLNP